MQKSASAEGFTVELATRLQRFAQTATVSQVAEAALSRSRAAAGLQSTSAVMKHGKEKKHSPTCARKRRAPRGSSPDFRRLFERSDAGAQ